MPPFKPIVGVLAALCAAGGIGVGLWQTGVIFDQTGVILNGGCGFSELADVYVCLDGDDANPGTAEQPVLTLNRAYRLASPGDTIEIADGDYPGQGIKKDASKTSKTDVTFITAPDAHVRIGLPWVSNAVSGLTQHGWHITFQGPEFEFAFISTSSRTEDVTFDDVQIHHMHSSRWIGLTIRNSRIGPNGTEFSGAAQDGIFIGAGGHNSFPIPKDILIENNLFADVQRPNATAHSDCLQFTAGENVTIRRNKFIRCADAAIIAKTDDGPMTNWLVENNWFDEGGPKPQWPGQPVDPFTFEVGTDGFATNDDCDGIVIRFNSINEVTRGPNCSGTIGSQFYGNVIRGISPSSCSSIGASWTLTYNLWDDSSAAACGSNALQADLRWVDGARWSDDQDLRKQAGSPAIDFMGGSGLECPSDDYFGNPRPVGAACDAGMHEKS